MNREHESPENWMNEPDPAQTRERLDQIEQRLKKARPRPPRLDVAALQRLAHRDMEAATTDRQCVAETRRHPGRYGRLYRRMAVVGTSWVCGAIAGALVMSLVMSRPIPNSGPTVGRVVQQITGEEEEISSSSTHAQGTAPDADRNPGPPDVPFGSTTAQSVKLRPRDAALLAVAFDPLASGNSIYGPEGPILRAGMHMVQYVQESSAVYQTKVPSSEAPEDDEQRRLETKSGPKSRVDLAPAITRERLRQDLLGELTGLLL